jgi:hypothetical protein
VFKKPAGPVRRWRPRPPTTDLVDAVNGLAKLMYDGGVASKSMNKPAAIAVRILAGVEVGLTPMQAVSNIMITNGKMTVWGDAALALVRASGELAEFAEGVEGSGDDRVGWCRATRAGGETVERRFSVEDAKVAELWGKAGPWTTYPERMLQMRARAWVIRDLFTDVLCGLGVEEEVRDYKVDVVKVAAEVVPTPADVPAIAGAPAVESPASSGPPVAGVADKTLGEIGLARPAYMRAKGIDCDDAEAVRGAWRETLRAYGVASAKDLTQADADRLLAELRAVGHDQEKKEVFGPGGAS